MAESPRHEPLSPDGLHALIIEDDLVSGLGMQMALTPLGFSSFAFASTQLQALEQAQLRRPDLMTVDINLLHGDGLDAVREIESALGGLRVLYVTGSPNAAGTLGGRELLCKPFGVADVQAAYARLA
jgi:ActR/RegA family two-component response regulator